MVFQILYGYLVKAIHRKILSIDQKVHSFKVVKLNMHDKENVFGHHSSLLNKMNPMVYSSFSHR